MLLAGVSAVVGEGGGGLPLRCACTVTEVLLEWSRGEELPLEVEIVCLGLCFCDDFTSAGFWGKRE